MIKVVLDSKIKYILLTVKRYAYFENDDGEVQERKGCGLKKNPCLNSVTLRSKEVHISLVKNEVLVTYRRAGCRI
jgi:hypothetical protein